jgi:asparagine synthase (glutamine-hydrolysing)
VQTFSIGYRDTDETEHHYAQEVATHLGTRHHEHLLMPDALELIEHLARVLDEPNGDSSCLPTFLLSKYTRQFVTVALSGDGGDELFGGYGRYGVTINEMGSWWERTKIRWRGRTTPTAADRYLSPRWLILQPEQVAALTGGMPDGAARTIARWRALLDDESRPLIHRLRNIDAEYYMPGAVLAKVDRMSMQSSLEVRCPLLDRDVAAFARELPARHCWQPPDVGKFLLKRLAERYLPHGVIHRRKMGFGLPTQSWSRDKMLGMAEDALGAPSSVLAGLLDRDALRRMLDAQHVAGQFSIYQVWPLLLLELWLRAHVPGRVQRREPGA